MTPTTSTSGNDSSPQPAPQRRHRAWRILGWFAVGVLGVLTLVLVVGTILLHNARFHSYLLATLDKRVSDVLGVEVQLENFELHLSNLSVDLYGLTVYGAQPYPTPPLLQVHHLQAGVKIVSILQKKWYFNTLSIDQPIVKVFVDAKGVSNLPKPKSSGSSSNTSVFDLGVRHAVLDRGEIYYNDRKGSLGADVHDVEFHAAFNYLMQKYTGDLSYTNGQLTSGSYEPIPHNLMAHFDATPTTFHLTDATLSSGDSSVKLTATVQDYSHPQVQAKYDVAVDGGEFRKLLKNPSIPIGVLRTSGTLGYQDVANQPALDSVVLSGDLSSQSLLVQSPTASARIDNLASHYTLDHGDAAVENLRAGLLGGELTASGKMTRISTNPHSKVFASLHHISLAAVERATRTSPMPKNVGLTGELNAEANAAWGKTLDDLVAHTDATLKGRVSGRNAESGQPTVVPVDGQIHGVYTGANKQLALSRSYVKMPQTSLTMNGTAGNRVGLNVRFETQNLGELETVADLVRTPVAGKPVQPLGLAGTALFQGVVTGSTAAPHLTGQLTASNVHVNGSEVKLLRTNVDVSPSFASLQNAVLEPAAQGRIEFSASTGLKKWAFTDTSPVLVTLAASQLNLADMEKLAGTQLPLTGTLNANVKLHGTELNPVGDGNVSLKNVTAYEEPIQSIALTFSGTGADVHGNLAVQMPAGDLASNFSVRPQQKTYTAQVDIPGLRLEKVHAVAVKSPDAKGVLQLHATGQGSFDNPQLDALLQIPKLEIQNQKLDGINLKLDVANHLANANLSTSALNTKLDGKARIELTGDYQTDATLDTQSIPLQPLLAIYAPAQASEVSGQTELHATLHGPLKNKQLLEAHVTIPVLKLAYSTTVQLAEVAPIRIDYKDSIVTLQHSAIKGTDTDLQFGASYSTVNKDAMAVTLLGTVDLKLAQLFSADVRSSGQVKFDIHSSGAANNPNLGGQIDIIDANYASGDLPLGLQHGNGVLTLTKDRVNISKFEGTVGGGKLTAQGGVAYRPAVQFDLGVAANGIRMLYPQGLRETLNANIRLAGTMENSVLGGSVDIANLSFTPAFDLTNFINQFSGGIASPPSVGFSQNVLLNLAVHSSNDMNLVSRTLSIDGTANLQVRGTAADPVILGRVDLNRGDVIFNGDRFVLNGGTIEFVNPSETEPVVNLTLNTSIEQYSIYMRFNGPIDQLRTNYSSDPALPSADIINLLAFGRTTEANAANPSTPANQAAEGLIASQVSSQVTSRFSKIAGISQLSINPVLAGGSSQGPPGANITIQQRVTGNLFVTFSSNVASTQNQTIMGEYRVSPKFSVSATRDQTGGFAVDTSIKRTW